MFIRGLAFICFVIPVVVVVVVVVCGGCVIARAQNNSQLNLFHSMKATITLTQFACEQLLYSYRSRAHMGQYNT